MSNDAEQPAENRPLHTEYTTAAEATTRPLDCRICSFESFEYHPDEDVYRAIFDATTVAPSMAVIGAVSTVAERDPLDIKPLHSIIDPDALDTLSGSQNPAGGDVHVRFSVAGYDVTVSSYGSVAVRPRHDENEE